MYNPAERINYNQPMTHYVANLQHQSITESYFPLIHSSRKMQTLQGLIAPKKNVLTF